MKLLRSSLEKSSTGALTVIPEDKEDLFTLYSTIREGDTVTLKTTRNIRGNNGKGKSEKRVITVALHVLEVDFVPEDDSFRIKGKITNELDDVSVGSHHTADVPFNQPIKIFKDEWEIPDLDGLYSASDVEARAEVAAVVMEEGIAHLCLITENMTIMKDKYTLSIPKKRRGDSSSHDKALNKFYANTAEMMDRVFDFSNLKAVILASPGFWAEGLYKAYLELQTKKLVKNIAEIKSKLMVTHSSTGYLQGLDEVLKTDTVQKQLSDTKYARDVMALDDFFKSLNLDDMKAWYGPKECQRAVEMGAVDKLLLTDKLYRANSIEQRKHYQEMAEQVKQTGGDVFVFSSLHDSGEQLDQITGVAVLLKYPVPDLDESEDEDEEEVQN